ncbi:molybdenum cofactor biosynthesis protein B [Marinagarivorans algicola]|uniref:molybdenum cofactor biosynthesis protein B n=1 Tax=Marinagarivorans algicola TaxID=1513270 RepID=UPI0006B6118F|nr:molybdenum cofactor biosynthesis protein B [Marinagarivorans algicola]
MSANIEFHSLNICVLTISDTRTFDNDTSGNTLQTLLEEAGHTVYDRKLVKDDIYQMRATVSHWIADAQAQVVLMTGGTGFAGRDSTPEAIQPLLDKTIDGYGELFRQLSYDDIGTSTIQSRAFAGLANRTLIFALPGSTGACTLGFSHIIQPQIDSRTRPCNFYGQIKFIPESMP